MKILITGADGLLGSNLCVIFSKHNVVCATNRTKPDIADCENHKMDIQKKQDLKLILDIKPDMVVHCAALTNVDYCEDHPRDAEKINSTGTKNVAKAAKKAGSYFVHISTDAVFDGEHGNYSEDDLTNPINVYARTKLGAEKNVEAVGGRYVIIRTNIYGWNRQEKFSLAEWMIDKFKKKQEFPAFRDVKFSPILVNNLSEAILELYSSSYTGILNVAGSESCTKLDFAEKLAKVFGFDTRLIKPADSDSVNLKAKRAKDMSLNTLKAQKLLKTKLLGIEEGLREFKSLRDKGYVSELRAVAEKELKSKEARKSQGNNRGIFAVIPAYNEGQTIAKVVRDVKPCVAGVIVVDDGSKDDTAKEAKRAGAIVVRQKNLGYDGAISAGFKEAQRRRAEIIFTFDADGQHNPDDIRRITFPIVEGECDVVVGVRPFKQRLAEYLFAAYSRRKIGVQDPLCGFKAYAGEVYRKVGHFDTVKSTGTQLIFEAHRAGFRIKEGPIRCHKRKDVPRFGRSLKGNYRILYSFLRILSLKR